MTNDHFISIFIISCILLGIQPSVSAQSSDWVYSPYAQYLTNNTTIPPPVGEPADAALSCFRHDTVYVLIMPTGQNSQLGSPTRLCRVGERRSKEAPQTASRFHFADFVTTTWVTDETGTEQQFLAYLPYGEPLLDKHLKTYDSRYCQDDVRYKFTGKERDREQRRG